MSVFLTIDENLRAAMRFFGNATGSGEIQELDGAVAHVIRGSITACSTSRC